MKTYIVWLVVLSNNSILCIKGIHRVYIFTSFWLQQFYFRLNETYVEIVCFIVRPTFQGNVAQQELLMLQILKFLLLVITLAFFSLQLAYFSFFFKKEKMMELIIKTITQNNIIVVLVVMWLFLKVKYSSKNIWYNSCFWLIYGFIFSLRQRIVSLW